MIVKIKPVYPNNLQRFSNNWAVWSPPFEAKNAIAAWAMAFLSLAATQPPCWKSEVSSPISNLM
jgi:hypothetical protein